MKTTQDQYSLPLVTKDAVDGKNIAVFKDIIGLVEPVRKLSFFVDSHSEQTPLPTFLFTGSQGLGKSFMAQKVAESLGRDLVEVNCGTILTAEDFVEKVLIDRVAGNVPKTLLLDESHSISTEVTTVLLTLLNPTTKKANYLAYKNWNIEYDFSKINTIFATTDAYKMFRPLVNRCTEIYFSLYSNDELYRILQHYLADIEITCDKEDLSYACRGRARDAFTLSQHIKRYCIQNSTKEFDANGWKTIKDIFGIHTLGLNTQELRLLKMLETSSPISCNNLAVRMGVNPQNIESEIEIRPRELGFVENGTRGRNLTAQGREYLKVCI